MTATAKYLANTDNDLVAHDDDDMEYTAMSGKERAICGTVCLCIALAVLSGVAMVYLTVIIYIPAQRELNSGFGESPVMCTTKDRRKIVGDIDACRWSSCTEWCLSRGGGDCTHLYVSVRSNGTNMDLLDCKIIYEKVCPTLDFDNISKHNCKEDHQCTKLDKMFRCENGICWNITGVYSWTYELSSTDPPLDCGKKRNCVELEGMYDCEQGRCRRINAWESERRCTDIATKNRNVIVQAGDKILSAKCTSAVETKSGEHIWKGSRHEGRILLASCTDLFTDRNRVRAYDCINGTLLPSYFFGDSTNFTVLQAALNKFGSSQRLDIRSLMLPFEQDITIFNFSRLMINHEGCVNTLQFECKKFYKDYGRDGRNQTSPARYPCYYDPHNSDFVVKRFNVAKTRYLFLMFFIIPAALLIFSCGVLFTCSRMLTIDNGGHMVVRCCNKQKLQAEQLMNNVDSASISSSSADDI